MKQSIVLNAVPIETVEAGLREICCELTALTLPHIDKVSGRAVLRNAGRYELMDIDCGIAGVARSKAATLRDGGRNLYLIFQKSGTVTVEEGARKFVARPGSLFLLDDTRPFRFFSEAGRVNQYSLHIPRALVPPELLTAYQALVGIEPHDLLCSSIRHLGEQMLETNARDAKAEMGSDLLFKLLDMHIKSQADNVDVIDEASEKQALFTRAHQVIDQNFREPGFRASELAETLNVSPRQLQRAFSGADTSPARAILERRLDYARATLEARPDDLKSVTVTTIAYEAGFNDLSYFYRAYRERFGRAPGERGQ